LYTMKMFLEFNLVVNKWTLLGHSVNIAASWGFIGFSLAAVVMASSSMAFEDLQKLDANQKYQDLCVLFVYMLLPFRLFTLIT